MQSSKRTADEVLAEVRSQTAPRTLPEPLTFRRRSRSGNKTRPHIMAFDPTALVPVDIEHPCSCAAGTDGRYCWAVLEWLRDEAPKRSTAAEVLVRARLAGLLIEERTERSAKHAAKEEQGK